jgi:hypothetical protein
MGYSPTSLGAALALATLLGPQNPSIRIAALCLVAGRPLSLRPRDQAAAVLSRLAGGIANKVIEGARCDHKPGMQGRFFPAVELGGIDVAPQLSAGLNSPAVVPQDAGAIGAVLAGGEYAKAAILGMKLQIGGRPCRDTGGPSQGAKTIQRPPACVALFTFRRRIRAIQGDAHRQTLHIRQGRQIFCRLSDLVSPQTGPQDKISWRDLSSGAGFAVSERNPTT